MALGNSRRSIKVYMEGDDIPIPCVNCNHYTALGFTCELDGNPTGRHECRSHVIRNRYCTL